MTKIKSINSNQLYIAQNAEVSLKLAGNTAQVTFTAGKNRKCPIKNLSKDEFVDLSTGEVKKRRHSENRFQSPKSVRKSINSLMDLIRCNATNPNICKWITLMDNVLTSTDAKGNVTTSTYDDKGNLTSVTNAAGNSISIAYNDKNQAVRLTNINDDDIIINYDSVESIISTTDADGYKTLYTYNDRNQPVTEETPEGKFTYSYDANGNLVSKSESVINQDGTYSQVAITESYTYDSFNRMTGYASGDISYSYTYDAEGVRRSKQNDNVQGSKITYISDTLCEYSQTLAEINRSGELNTSYTIGLELISLTRGEEEYYYISDGHGDVRIITDEDGHVKTKYRYNGYGELIETSGDIENSHMYAGECYDEESGLYYLRARYMNPSTGTFTGMDSYAGNISDPDTLHKYLYANGNPVKYVDPSGNMATIGEGSVALGISNILDNADTIFVMGILNGLLSVGINNVFGDSQEYSVVDSFFSGFFKGAAFGALAFFVSGLFLIDVLKVFLCDAGVRLTEDFLLSWYYTFKGDNGKAIEYRIYSLIDLLIFGLLYNANLKTNKTKAVDLQGKAKIKASDYDPIEGGSKSDVPLLETSKYVSGETNDHHIIPRFSGKSKPYADFIAERGIDVDQYTITVSAGKEGMHMNSIHGKGNWNPLWMEWIDTHPNATAKDIFQFAGKMMDDFGLSGYEIHPFHKGGK